MISGYDGQTSTTTEVGWFALLVPVLVNNSGLQSQLRPVFPMPMLSPMLIGKS